jgi:hypothetical protein
VLFTSLLRHLIILNMNLQGCNSTITCSKYRSSLLCEWQQLLIFRGSFHCKKENSLSD